MALDSALQLTDGPITESAFISHEKQLRLPVSMPIVKGSYLYDLGALVMNKLTGEAGRVVDRYRDTKGNDRYEVLIRTSRKSHPEWMTEAELSAA